MKDDTVSTVLTASCGSAASTGIGIGIGTMEQRPSEIFDWLE